MHVVMLLKLMKTQIDRQMKEARSHFDHVLKYISELSLLFEFIALQFSIEFVY